jgi:Ser/Thr protein kinase RdoA (MazF antagonist)
VLPPSEPEAVLAGGNMTPVVRVGDTVRRATGPWTPTIHALLRHVRRSGFPQVPEPLGIVDHDREILSLLRGRVATYPLAAFVLSDETLTTAARTLRAYHDATAGFTAPPGAAWQSPAHEPAEVICHNDFAPYNVMFEGAELTGVIDFDVAAPGPRIRDMGYAAYRFVPLTDPANPDVPYSGVEEQARRLALFCSAYGEGAARPVDVVDRAAAKLRELVAFIVDRAAAGDAAQRAVLARGDTEIYARDIAYLERRREGLARHG